MSDSRRKGRLRRQLVYRPLWVAVAQLLLAASVTLSWVLRERPYSTGVIIAITGCVALMLIAAVSVVVLVLRPQWQEQRFAPLPLYTRSQLRVYTRIVGSLAVTGILCLTLAFVLSQWPLGALAVGLLVGAVVAASIIDRYAGGVSPAQQG